MRRILVMAVFVLCVLLPGEIGCPVTPDKQRVGATMATYGSLPKGVLLEGVAEGFESLRTLAYDRSKNCLIVNGRARYPLPVTRARFREIVLALQRDDRLGVSIVLGERDIVYGALEKASSIARHMRQTDLFLIAVVFGWIERLGGTSLPAAYTPRQAEGGRPTVCYHTFTDYRFRKLGDTYRLANVDLRTTLVPMGAGRAADGGYVPDWEALRQNRFDPTYRANADHVQQYEDAYLRLPAVRQTARCGEAAAVIRYLKRSGVNLRVLAAELR